MCSSWCDVYPKMLCFQKCKITGEYMRKDVVYARQVEVVEGVAGEEDHHDDQEEQGEENPETEGQHDEHDEDGTRHSRLF